MTNLMLQDGHGATKTIMHLMKQHGSRVHQLDILNQLQHLLNLGNKTINLMPQDGLGVIRTIMHLTKLLGLKVLQLAILSQHLLN